MARKHPPARTRSLPATTASSWGAVAPWLGWALLILLLDQFTKTLIVGEFVLGESRPVTVFFNLVRVHNTGAAFSFLADAGGWQRWFFVALGAAATGFIVWMLKSHPGQRLFALALSGIMGGALGNVIDRLIHGYVVDFIQLHAGGWAFPSFNLADMAITGGAALLLIDEFLRVRRSR